MTLSPQAAEFLQRASESDAPGWEEMSPVDGREVFAGLIDWFGTGPEMAHVGELAISDQIRARVYRPTDARRMPAVLYFHGGGWVLGDLDTHDAACRHLAAESAAVVVAVHYRRAPEARFPTAFEDAVAATRYVFERASELNVDPERISVAGDSAGGNLAAAVALACRQLAIRLQVLIYPALDCRCDSESYRELASGYGLTATAMQWFWNQYLGESGPRDDPRHSPVFADDLTGLPPAHIVTAEYDVLRTETEQYASLLREAGVPTTLRQYDGNIHGFVHMNALFEDGRRALQDIGRAIRSVNESEPRQ